MKIELFENQDIAVVNGKEVKLDTNPLIHNDRLLVPIRFIAENMGLNVEWDDKSKKATLYTRKTRFATMDECAIDFYMYWNAMSIGLFREIGATIKKDASGYYWDGVFVGKQTSVQGYKFDWDNAVAILHTHGGLGGSDYFSSDDKVLSRKHKMPIYMASPMGNCWVYNPEDTSIKKIWDSAPTDLREMPQYKKYDMRKNISAFNNYFSKYHELNEQPLGYVADYYNKLYSQGKCYILRVDADTEGEIIV